MRVPISDEGLAHLQEAHEDANPVLAGDVHQRRRARQPPRHEASSQTGSERNAGQDDGLANLTGMQELVWLNLWNTPVGNAGMEHVAKLTKLIYLNLDNTAVDDDGLEVDRHVAGTAR